MISPSLIDKLAVLDLDFEDSLARSDGFHATRFGYPDPSGMNPDEFRDSVLRDLRQLLNTRTHWPHHPLAAGVHSDELREVGEVGVLTLADFPYALTSVVNFGMPDMTGLIELTMNPQEVADLIKTAILAFEPRLDPDTLEVALLNPSAEDISARPSRPGEGRFLVEAELLIKPRPEHFSFVLKSEPLTAQLEVAD